MNCIAAGPHVELNFTWKPENVLLKSPGGRALPWLPMEERMVSEEASRLEDVAAVKA